MDLKTISIGLEFGSTRIKAVAIDGSHKVIAYGEHDWENRFENGVWTYSMEMVENGLHDAFSGLQRDFLNKHGIPLSTCGALGISGMMHGYLVLDRYGNVLAPFRTWRNTMTGEAAAKLSALFGFSIPQRWSIAHIYQSILNGDKEVGDIDMATTLSGYIHYRLTGQHVLGIGEASGMFPIDPITNDYYDGMLAEFDNLVDGSLSKPIRQILPEVALAGVAAGILTEEGARFLDPTGVFQPGVPLVPPEGDMGTGMVATNSVALHTGNASIGTSSNVTIVTGKALPPDPRVDIIAGPSGNVAALIHVNNGTSDINKWVNLLHEAIVLGGGDISKKDLFERLFNLALETNPGTGGLLQYNTASGEPMLGINEGRPMLLRSPDSQMGVGTIMKSSIYSLLCPIRIGLDILKAQGVTVDVVTGHGGFFKTKAVGALFLSAAIGSRVSNLYSSSEGGPYGMALLASYYLEKKEGETLEDYLAKVFGEQGKEEFEATPGQVEDFRLYYEDYLSSIPALKEAINTFKA